MIKQILMTIPIPDNQLNPKNQGSDIFFGIINPWLKGDDLKSSPATANVEHIPMNMGLLFFNIKIINPLLKSAD